MLEASSSPPLDDGELRQWLSTPAGLCEATCEIAGEPLIFDAWQRDFINSTSRFWIGNKSRQAGFSFACGARGWARCYLEKPNSYLAVFVSYNLNDAHEKIRYVNQFDESMPSRSRMKRASDSKTEIEFSNGNRIVTMFLPRGKGPADVMLDELAHITEAEMVHQAAMPMTARGGSLSIGSSPLGKRGRFFEVWNGAEGKFAGFERVEIPWWTVRALCSDLARARELAPAMTTEERVEAFGSEAMQEIFANYFLEDFKQEFECAWADESTAGLPWELIERCSPTDSPPLQFSSLSELSTLRGELYAGMDVGRRINASEFVVGERFASGRIEERFRHTMQNAPLPQQEEFAARILQIASLRCFTVDYTGLGLHIGDSLAQRFGSRVKLVAMSSVSKPQVFNNARAMMERDLFLFYPDREVRRQFHSIKKVITSGGNVVFDIDRNEKHHADKFWASALMLWGAADTSGAGRPCIAVLSAPRSKKDAMRID